MLLKRNVFRIVCALFYLPVALLSMFEIINLVMTNSQNRYFLVGGVVFGVLLFLIAAYFIKQKKWLIIAENSRPISIILEMIIVVLVGVGLFLWQNLVYGWKHSCYIFGTDFMHLCNWTSLQWTDLWNYQFCKQYLFSYLSESGTVSSGAYDAEYV